MRVLLLCGYRRSLEDYPAIGVQTEADGITHIDQRIAQLQRLGLEVTCVLAGGAAESQLRQCRRVVDAELVFDTTPENELNVFSNVRAGLKVTSEACLVLPVELPCPEAALWRFLQAEWARIGFRTPLSLIQAATQRGAVWHPGFPLLVTRSGNALIQENEYITSLLDPRLEYHRPVYTPEAALAPEPKPL